MALTKNNNTSARTFKHLSELSEFNIGIIDIIRFFLKCHI